MKKILTLVLSSLFLLSSSWQQASSADVTCSLRQYDTFDNPDWTARKDTNLNIVMKWTIQDPNRCIVGFHHLAFDDDFFINYQGDNTTYFPTKWGFTRAEDAVLISAKFTIPREWMDLWSMKNVSTKTDPLMTTENVKIFTKALLDRNGEWKDSVRGFLSGPQIWALWLQETQGLDTDNCEYPSPDASMRFLDGQWKPTYDTEIINHGNTPTVKIKIRNTRQCIFLIHTGPIQPANDFLNRVNYLAETPFYMVASEPFFSDIAKDPTQVIQVGLGEFATNAPKDSYSTELNTPLARIGNIPLLLPHSDSIIQNGDEIEISTKLDLTNIKQDAATVGIFLGHYFWYSRNTVNVLGSWSVNWTSSTTFTAQYRKGGYIPAGKSIKYETQFINLSLNDLKVSPQEKAAAEKAAAEKAAAEKAAAEKAAARKKSTITCIKKGRSSKKVTGINPKCPAGYTKK